MLIICLAEEAETGVRVMSLSCGETFPDGRTWRGTLTISRGG